MAHASDAIVVFDAFEHWPFFTVLARMGLSVGIGVFIGLEREHRHKTGVRTFALVALLSCLGGFLGHFFIAIVAVYVGLVVLLMNARELWVHQRSALTTSVALMLVALCGVLCGMGHVFAPVAASIIAAALLAWKQPIHTFVGGLTEKELRAAILLAILTGIILPVLPAHPVDRWQLIEPRENWASVVIIAGIGFVNYILLRMLGPRGMEITAFFGGLVNSRKTVVELMSRLREVGEGVMPSVYRGIMLSMGSMVVRNALVVIVFATGAALLHCAIPFGLMLMVVLVLWRTAPAMSDEQMTRSIQLESPFNLWSALKFGSVFLVLNVAGGLAQRTFGTASFYFVCAAGGLLSSASSIAAAANLIGHQDISVVTGTNGIILSSVTSILANIPLVSAMTKDAKLRRRLTFALVMTAGAVLVGTGLNYVALPDQ